MTTNHPDPTPPPVEPAPSLHSVEELQALCDTASPLPWVKHDDAMMHIARAWPNNVAVIATMRDIDAGPMGIRSSVNRDLIVAAVNALPSLLARLRAAEETLAAVERLHFPYDCTAAGRTDHETCGQREWCYSCGEDQPWPCTTFQAIRDAALAEGASR